MPQSTPTRSNPTHDQSIGGEHVFFTCTALSASASFASTKTHPMKATTISFNRAILPYACTLLLGACGPGQKQEEKNKQHEEKGAPSAAVAVDCSVGNIYEDRKKHYGDTKLGDLVTKFHDHFRLRAGGAKIMNTPLAIPWKAFDDARKVVESDIHPIAGIYFNYGIDGNKFQPVVDFMYQKTVGSDLKVLPDASFEFDGAKLVSIDEKGVWRLLMPTQLA
ncbi:MAG: hypothetical protein IPO90_13210 [Flavobacteriales bacterium]|nr:hypothetical protein [Flavobacteriales bacterium]